jgi:hypothetical protein
MSMSVRGRLGAVALPSGAPDFIPASATNGNFAAESRVKAEGAAGASIPYPRDSFTLAANPADRAAATDEFGAASTGGPGATFALTDARTIALDWHPIGYARIASVGSNARSQPQLPT